MDTTKLTNMKLGRSANRQLRFDMIQCEMFDENDG